MATAAKRAKKQVSPEEKKFREELERITKIPKDKRNEKDKQFLAHAKEHLFKTIGNSRLMKIMKAIDNLGKLANKNRYTWSPAQVEAMKKNFQVRLTTLFQKFEGVQKTQQQEDIL